MSIPVNLDITLRTGEVKSNVRWFTMSYGSNTASREAYLNRLRWCYSELKANDDTRDKFVPYFDDIVNIKICGKDFIFTPKEIENENSG